MSTTIFLLLCIVIFVAVLIIILTESKRKGTNGKSGKESYDESGKQSEKAKLKAK